MSELVKIGSTAVKQNWISLPTQFTENLIVITTSIFNNDDWNNKKIRSGGLFRIRYPTFFNIVTEPIYFPVDADWKLFDISLSSNLTTNKKKPEIASKQIQVKLSSQFATKFNLSSFAPWGVTAYKIID